MFLLRFNYFIIVPLWVTKKNKELIFTTHDGRHIMNLACLKMFRKKDTIFINGSSTELKTRTEALNVYIVLPVYSIVHSCFLSIRYLRHA